MKKLTINYWQGMDDSGKGGRRMDQYSETMLHIISSLKHPSQTVTAQAAKSSMAWTAPGADCDSALAWLVRNGYVTQTDDRLTLTQMGTLEAKRIRDRKVREEFDHLIDRCTRSGAYLDFCEELYGYRLYLFNMMDKRQLDDLFVNLRPSSKDTVIDVGCGAGCLLNRIVEQNDCRGVGIDRLSAGIVNRLSPAIEYRQTDMDETYDFNASAVLFVDSLYFSRDMESLLSRLEGGARKAYLYYSTYLFEDTDDTAMLREGQTCAAKALNQLGFAYKAIDYSKCEYALYKRGLKLLGKYESHFAAEGMTDVYERRLAEYKFGAALFEKGKASRYLYTVGNA